MCCDERGVLVYSQFVTPKMPKGSSLKKVVEGFFSGSQCEGAVDQSQHV